jgi:hypothetical protein
MDGLIPDTSDVSLFVEQANVVVDEELVGSGLTDARLRLVELNLAAHYATVAVERGGLNLRRIGETEERYQATQADAVKLSSTRFGQQAISLDPTGKLSQMNSPRGTAEFRVL